MLGFVISSVVYVLFVLTLTMLHMKQVSSLRADARGDLERLNEQYQRNLDKLLAQNHGLQTNLIARNDREFALLYGNAPQETVLVETEPSEEEYTQQVIDLAEDRFLLGLDDEPVGIPFPAE